jgi:hypothetical protein
MDPVDREEMEGRAVSDPDFKLEAYYDSERKCYLVQDEDHNWISVTDKCVQMRLDDLGISMKRPKGKPKSKADSELIRIQHKRSVCYADSLAGYDAGLHLISGYKMLVTHSPRRHKDAPGDWSLIKEVLDGLLIDGEIDQRVYFHGWLKVADHSLRRGTYIPGPALAIAGPVRSGKSLLSDFIAFIYGDRKAYPYRYMTGRSEFNRDLIKAETLIVDDEVASRDPRSRRAFGQQIKSMLFGGSVSAHAKRKDAVTVRPHWRLVVSLNDEPENLMILPPIDDSLEDKLMLLRAVKKDMPMPTNTPDEKSAFWQAIIAQVPAYLHWLRNEFQIPLDLSDPRTGIYAFKHPHLVQALNELAPEFRLLILIDNAIFRTSESPIWEGTAEDLHYYLCESPYKIEAKALLAGPNATGTYLGRLEKRYPNRVERHRQAVSREWKLSADPLTPKRPPVGISALL